MATPASNNWAERQVARLALFMSHVAGWGYVACALLITFDVLARNLFDMSSKATVELSGYALGFGIAWGLAGAFVARMHVRVDMLLEKLPRTPRAWLHLLSLLLLIAFLAVIAYGVIYLAQDSWELDAHDLSALRIPLWLPQAIFAAGIVVFIVAALVMLISVVGHLLRGDVDGVNTQMRQKSAEEEAEEAIHASHAADSPAAEHEPALRGGTC